MLEGEALAVVSGREDPVTPTLSLPVTPTLSLPVAPPSLPLAPAVPEDFPPSASPDRLSESAAARACDPAPGTTLDEPKPFSERSADAGVGVILVCEPPEPEAAPSPSPVPPGRAAVRFGAASTRA